jgi:hypothetical protein
LLARLREPPHHFTIGGFPDFVGALVVEDSIIEDSIILDESDESGPLTSWTEVAGKKKKKTDGPKPIKLEGKQSVEKLTLFTKRS